MLVDSEQTPKHGVKDLIDSVEGVVPSRGVAVCEVNPVLILTLDRDPNQRMGFGG